ncbi:hypothetical protein ACPCHT_24030 [Nucisporomicrobium flavum]|jgi:hypothetical protein|uniref:hypothetical protein n=1 Tax=Nucisporomicrobium flavum TaxID=2785915 RepID=UPI0018F6C1BD|nr:hypothetical protein [Nucisporomicrobium flavum]
MADHLQNDPDRAGGLVADAQGEFVEQESGGAFDPRAFRSSGSSGSEDSTDPARPEPDATAGPPMDGERMVGPGEEIDKAR